MEQSRKTRTLLELIPDDVPRIFVIEDELIIALEIQSLIESFGYKCVGNASTGNDAIQKIEKVKPDIVLTDINIKGEINGIETAMFIKEKTDAGIIFITAYTDDHTLSQAKKVEPLAFITKPFNERELKSNLEMGLFKVNSLRSQGKKDEWHVNILNNMKDSIITTDSDGKITFINLSAKKLLNIGNDNIVNTDVTKIFTPKNSFNDSLVYYSVGDVVKGKNKYFPMEETFIEYEKGKKTTIDFFITPVLNKEKDVEGLIFVIEDLTEEKAVEKHIEENKQKFQNLIENSPAIIITFSSKRGLLSCSSSIEAVLGYKNTEFLLNADLFFQLINEQEEKLRRQQIAVLHQKETATCEYTIKDKNGKRKSFIEKITFVSKTNDEIIYQSVALDNTPLKAKDALIKLQSSALNSAYECIVITNTEGKIVWSNQAVERLTGYKPSEILLKTPDIFNSGKQSKEFYDNMWKKILSGNVWIGELINKKKNGELYHEEMNITPVVNEKNNITSFIAFKQDISERKKYELEIIEAKNKAEESDRLKSEFMAQMSHEIRTPLNIISSNSAFLKEEYSGKLDSELTELINSIENGSARLNRTMDLILNMSMIKAGVYEIEYTEIDIVQDILTPLFSKFKNKVDAAKINFEMHKNLTINSLIIADKYSVEKIFEHLLENAVTFTEKGFVYLEILNESENSLSVSVIDSGIGISEEFLPNLFKPFVQESHGYTRNYDGNGLGLALVEKYCEMNNAEIFVESKKNVGSTFTVKFKKVKNG